MIDHICEICLESIDSYEPYVRVGGDSIVHDSSGNCFTLTDGSVSVMALFHHDCIEVTMADDDVCGVPYVDEARQILIANRLSNEVDKAQLPSTAGRSISLLLDL